MLALILIRDFSSSLGHPISAQNGKALEWGLPVIAALALLELPSLLFGSAILRTSWSSKEVS
jgi:hypothetical protein